METNQIYSASSEPKIENTQKASLVSKYLIILLVLLPIIGAALGYFYAQSKVVEAPVVADEKYSAEFDLTDLIMQTVRIEDESEASFVYIVGEGKDQKAYAFVANAYSDGFSFMEIPSHDPVNLRHLSVNYLVDSDNVYYISIPQLEPSKTATVIEGADPNTFSVRNISSADEAESLWVGMDAQGVFYGAQRIPDMDPDFSVVYDGPAVTIHDAETFWSSDGLGPVPTIRQGSLGDIESSEEVIQ